MCSRINAQTLAHSISVCFFFVRYFFCFLCGFVNFIKLANSRLFECTSNALS